VEKVSIVYSFMWMNHEGRNQIMWSKKVVRNKKIWLVGTRFNIRSFSYVQVSQMKMSFWLIFCFRMSHVTP